MLDRALNTASQTDGGQLDGREFSNKSVSVFSFVIFQKNK